MAAIRTAALAAEPDHVAPAGAARVRLLLQFPAGELTHATVPSGEVGAESCTSPSAEWFYILEGSGALWDGQGEQEIDLLPGRAIRIPSGSPYQFLAHAELTLLVLVLPRWRPEYVHLHSSQHWTPTTKAGAPDEVGPVREPSEQVEVWDLRSEPDYSAPDGSLIYLLGDEQAGGLSQCVLPVGGTTIPVRHRTVEELWFVVEGEGEISRRDGPLPAEITPLRPGTCVDIGRGITFQFRNTREDVDLRMILLTMPRWPGPHEAVPVPGAASWNFFVRAQVQ